MGMTTSSKMNALFWILFQFSIVNVTDLALTTNLTTAVPKDPCLNIKSPFLKDDLTSREPFAVFREWFNLAKQCDQGYNIMNLATSSKAGVPSVRNVLLVGEVVDGFVFFTHYNSLKGRQLEENPVAAGMIYYAQSPPTDRQILFTGSVSKLTKEQSDIYWNSVSTTYKLINYLKQGRPVRSEGVMSAMRNETILQHPEHTTMMRPPTWGGYKIRPHVIEFAQGANELLRDRIVFKRLDADELFDPVVMERGTDGWVIYRILP